MIRFVPALASLILLGSIPAQAMAFEHRDAFLRSLRDQISRCYMAPIGASSARVRLEIRLRRDGSLAGPVKVIGQAPDTATAKAAIRSIQRCSPFQFGAEFRSSYDQWKRLQIEFETSQ
ncbi:hypothetical protein [Microvirga puerhi]|uniref:Cell envelope integrity protein TolA n=1 Tax=Microvirga puerhi TaxID=2876078 RepID=A0ABS7VQV8_9HYPH|nr:hypothetical protein [Microvirga puerhi]MBZ6077500.1 hypothetical protein [Microvirga puerhi]